SAARSSSRRSGSGRCSAHAGSAVAWSSTWSARSGPGRATRPWRPISRTCTSTPCGAMQPERASMLGPILPFHVRQQLRQPLFWLTATVFVLLTFTATVTDSVSIGGAIGNVHRNAPFVVVQMLGIMSVIAAFAVVAFTSQAVLRDFDSDTHELVFSRPV